MRDEWRGLDALLGAEDMPAEQAAFVERLRATQRRSRRAHPRAVSSTATRGRAAAAPLGDRREQGAHRQPERSAVTHRRPTDMDGSMDFDIPQDIQELLKDLDDFIEAEIKPLEQQDDNMRFFDHRREYARTDYENGGVPRKDWEDLLREMRAPRRQGGLPALRHPGEVRRPRRHEPRDGHHPRAPRREGPRPAQRPAERVVDRRQLPDDQDVGELRQRGAEEASSSTACSPARRASPSG